MYCHRRPGVGSTTSVAHRGRYEVRRHQSPSRRFNCNMSPKVLHFRGYLTPANESVKNKITSGTKVFLLRYASTVDHDASPRRNIEDPFHDEFSVVVDAAPLRRN